MSGQKTFPFLASAATFILLEVAALVLLHSNSTAQNIWINRASHRTMAFLWGGSEALRNQFRMDEYNAELQAEIARLQERLRAYEQREQAQVEQEHVAGDESSVYHFIPATVVKMSRNRVHNYIILNKGSEDGVRPRSGIISSRGVVGIVEAVDKHYAYGLTLMNPEMSVGARLGTSEQVGPLFWDGTGTRRALMRNLSPHYVTKPGDTVRTSGYSFLFPPDIPLGVTGKSRLVDGSTREVEVFLFQDFATLRYVTVVDNLDRAEIAALEGAEEGVR